MYVVNIIAEISPNTSLQMQDEGYVALPSLDSGLRTEVLPLSTQKDPKILRFTPLQRTSPSQNRDAMIVPSVLSPDASVSSASYQSSDVDNLYKQQLNPIFELQKATLADVSNSQSEEWSLEEDAINTYKKGVLHDRCIVSN